MANLSRRPQSSLKRVRHQDRGPRTEYLAFVLAGDAYAAPVDLVREILKPPPLTPVPRAPHSVMGIVSVRGQLVTVVDLRRRLRVAEAQPTRRTRILLVAGPLGEMLGVYVDEVLQVYRLAADEIEHAATALGGDVASYIVGIARPASQSGMASSTSPVIILLDLRAMLDA